MSTLKIRCTFFRLFFMNALFHNRLSLDSCAKIVQAFIFFMLTSLYLVDNSAASPVNGIDSWGEYYAIDQRPKRVVSLVPEITEILIAIDAADALVGITQHTVAPETANKTIIGGFLSPEIEKIEALNPDLILAADLHHEVRDHFRDKCPILTLNVFSIKDAMERLTLLGRIFERTEAAGRIIAGNREQLDKVAGAVAMIPTDKRQRAIRLMGQENLMVPGDNSFQNDFIRAAGAIAPEFGKKGQAVSISPEEWQRFDPQAVYICGSGEFPEILSAPGVKKVSAVRNGRIYSFSCDLTCRAGVNIGKFVTLLAGRIYAEELPSLSSQVQSGKPSNCVLNEK